MPTTGDFAGQVEKWTDETDRRLIAVVRESALGAAESMTKSRGAGGNMPVSTGNLRNSLAASLSGRPAIDWTPKRKFTDLSEVPSIIASAQPGHTIFLGFRAPYAEKVEFGRSGGFWRLTIQRWKQIVAEATGRVKGGGP